MELLKFNQMSLWESEERGSYINKNKKKNIKFRHSISEIPTTTFGTFSIYKYPAKFIPQVIAYVLKNYSKKGDIIFDPFAGYGTTGLVARIFGFDYIIWDLNPILNFIHDTAIIRFNEIDLKKIFFLLKEIKFNKKIFLPQWSNLQYWFPQDFLSLISNSWGFVNSIENLNYRLIFTIALLKLTRYFSYSDEKVHKLYRSKFSKEKVEWLLKKSNWKDKFYYMLKKEVLMIIKKIQEYNLLHPKEVNYEIRSGIDTLNFSLDREVDILITSPPYLQAQEYIRSTKLELFWLGFSEEKIKSLAQKEIPYRQVNEEKVFSDKFYFYLNQISEKHLIKLYKNYFYSILKIFTNLGKKIRKYMFIFVGPAKIRSIPIPIDEIIIEHMSHYGWIHELTLIDKIVSRVMFQSKINPANKLKDSRIKTEHLVILKKNE